MRRQRASVSKGDACDSLLLSKRTVGRHCRLGGEGMRPWPWPRGCSGTQRALCEMLAHVFSTASDVVAELRTLAGPPAAQEHRKGVKLPSPFAAHIRAAAVTESLALHPPTMSCTSWKLSPPLFPLSYLLNSSSNCNKGGTCRPVYPSTNCSASGASVHFV